MYSRYDLISLVCVLFDLAIPTSFFNFIQLLVVLTLLSCLQIHGPQNTTTHKQGTKIND